MNNHDEQLESESDGSDGTSPYDSYSDDDLRIDPHDEGDSKRASRTDDCTSVTASQTHQQPQQLQLQQQQQPQQQLLQQGQPQLYQQMHLQLKQRKQLKNVKSSLRERTSILYNFLKAHKRPASAKQWSQVADQIGNNGTYYYANALEAILVTQDNSMIESRIRQLLQQHQYQQHPNKNNRDHLSTSAATTSTTSTNTTLPPPPPMLVVWGCGIPEDQVWMKKRKKASNLNPNLLSSKGRFLEETCRRHAIPYIRVDNCLKLQGYFVRHFFRKNIFGVMVIKVKPDQQATLLRLRELAPRLHEEIGFFLQKKEKSGSAATTTGSYTTTPMTATLPASSSSSVSRNGSSYAAASTYAGDTAVDGSAAQQPPSKKQRLGGDPTSASALSSSLKRLALNQKLQKLQQQQQQRDQQQQQQALHHRSSDLAVAAATATTVATSAPQSQQPVEKNDGLAMAMSVWNHDNTVNSAPVGRRDPENLRLSSAIENEPKEVKDDNENGYHSVPALIEGKEVHKPITVPISHVNREAIHMEEEVTLLENVLKGLRERKQTLVQERKTAEVSLQHLVTTETPVLESQVSNLRSTLKRQMDLHNKISQSLAKSRASLARLLASDEDMTVEEIAKLAKEQDGIDREVDADLGRGTSSIIVDSAQVSAAAQHHEQHDNGTNKNPSEEPREDGRVADETRISLYGNFSTHVKEIPVLTMEYSLLFEGIQDKLCVLPFETPNGLNQLWQQRNTNDKIAGFHPCLRTTRVIRSILDISCREILALDEQLFPEAHDRRDAFQNTCLDARLLSGNYYSRLEQMALPNSLSVGNSSEKNIRAPVVQNGNTTSTASRVDPNVTLCPYELAGVCADSSCSYQHLQERPFGQILAREYIPLPPLRLSGDTSSGAAKVNANAEGRQKSQVALPRPAHPKSSSDRNGEFSARDAVEKNEDFIVLPDSPGHDGSWDDSSDSSCEAVEDCRNDSSWTWWQSSQEKESTIKSSTDGYMSFIETLRSFGCKLVDGKLAMDAPLETLQVCLFCGKVVESFRLSLHAGRFDVTTVLARYAADVASSWWNPEHSNVVSALTSVCSKVFETLNHVHEFAYAYDCVVQKSLFQVAAESQMMTSLTSFFLLQLHNFLIESATSVSDMDLDEWVREAEALVALHEFVLAKPGTNQELLRELNEKIKPFVVTDEGDSRENGGMTSKAQHRRQLYRLLVQDILQRNCIPDISAFSVASLIDDFLQPSWDESKHLLESDCKTYEEKYQIHARVICKMVNSCLRSLECAVGQGGATSRDSFITTEMSQLYSAVNKIVVWLQRLAESSNPTFEFMITPVLAANNSLACTVQLYDITHRVLVRLLAPSSEGDRRGVPCFTHLSEMLWSQLIQQRMTLPPFARREEPRAPSFELPNSVSEVNELIACRVDTMGVFPHHVSLSGDWNLIRRHNDPQGKFDQQAFHRNCRDLLLSLHHPLCVRFHLNDFHLKLRNLSPESQFQRSALPHSLLLAGASIVILELTSCGLKSLPFHFGHYFPILENLVLDRNELKELPPLLSQLKRLVVLKVDDNYLEHLPSSFGFPKLVEMSLEGNMLRHLPESIGECQELQVLSLRRNKWVPYDFASLATRLPKLRSLTVDGVQVD